MLKNILNFEGAQKLTKNEQKSINGGNGIMTCAIHGVCGSFGGHCVEEKCQKKDHTL